MHNYGGRLVDNPVGSTDSRTRFRALGASRLLSRHPVLNDDSAVYLSVASLNSIHWSPRGVHVTRSRMA